MARSDYLEKVSESFSLKGRAKNAARNAEKEKRLQDQMDAEAERKKNNRSPAIERNYRRPY